MRVFLKCSLVLKSLLHTILLRLMCRFQAVNVSVDGDSLANVRALSLTRTLAAASASQYLQTEPSSCTAQHPDPMPTTTQSEKDCVHVGRGRGDDSEEPLPWPPPSDPKKRLVIGFCFNELKARTLAVNTDMSHTVDAVDVADDTSEAAVWDGQRDCDDATASSKHHFHGLGSALESWVLPLVTRREGFALEVDGVLLRAAHGVEVGRRLDSLALQVKALGSAMTRLPGRWVGDLRAVEKAFRAGVHRVGGREVIFLHDCFVSMLSIAAG